MCAAVEVATEGRGEVVGVAGGVGDDVIAPVVKHAPVRIGEAVGHIAVKAIRARLVAIDRAVHIAHGAFECLDVGAVEDTIAEIHGTAGFIADGIGFVMRICGIQTVNNALFPVAFAIAIRVADIPHVGGLHDEHTIFIKLKTSGAVQTVKEGGAFREFAGLGVDVEDQELVEDLGGRGGFRVARPGGHPQASARVEVHLHGVDEVGELHFGGDEIHLHTFGRGEVLECFRAAEIRHRLRAVGGHGRHRWEVVVLHFVALALRGCPDGLVAVGGLHITLGQFGTEDGGIVHAVGLGDGVSVFDAGALAEDVVLIHGAVAVVPLDVLLQHGFANFGDVRVIHARRFFAEQRFELHWGERLVSSLAEMHAIDGQWPCCAGIQRLRSRKEIDKRHAVGLGDFGHGCGVSREVFVVGSAVREIGALEVFMGDGREEHHTRPALAVVGVELLFQILIQGLFEVGQSSLPFERLIEAPVGQDDVRVEVCACGIDHIGLAHLRRQCAGFHVQEILRGGDFIAAWVDIDLVRRETEISNGELEVGVGLMNQRLQPAVVLLPVCQTAADDGDVIALLEFDLSLKRDGEGEEDGEQFLHVGWGRKGSAIRTHMLNVCRRMRKFCLLSAGS